MSYSLRAEDDRSLDASTLLSVLSPSYLLLALLSNPVALTHDGETAEATDAPSNATSGTICKCSYSKAAWLSKALKRLL